MAQELILEIGTEELPAGYVPMALESLKTSARDRLQKARIGFGEVRTLGTPRRLVLEATAIADRQEDLVQEQQGPAKKVAFDEGGRPTKAAVGFAQGKGIKVEDLTVKETPRGEYVFARVLVPGRPTGEILASLLPELIGSLSFPKSMRWGSGQMRFARPIRWILALLGDVVIPFSVGEIASGEVTFGHRQMSPGPFRVSTAGAYWDVMATAGILVDQAARRQAIWQGLIQAAAAKGGRPLADDALLDVVTHLVEVPSVLCGEFDQSYLALPREVLTTALSEHQKYFAVVDDQDRLLPLFLAVSNGDPQGGQLIVSGHRKVLTARLEDAKFFFEEDRQIPLEDRVELLKGVVFQEDLGTLYQKTERVVALAEHLAGQLELSADQAETAHRAALLCKADLVTHMVGEKEYSRLQGYMGKQYALASGEPLPVAEAIFEHYLPRFAEDRLPESVPGSLVAVADKVDTVIGCFAVGLVPTGSQDPYALRRGALGVIRILLFQRLKVDLSRLVDRALDLLEDKLKAPRATVREGAWAFFRQRLEGQLEDMGLDQDVVEAALAADDRLPVDAFGRAEALQSFRAHPGFTRLVQSSKRVANILRHQEVAGPPQADLFPEQAERQLLRAANTAREHIAAQIRSGDFAGALEATLGLVSPIDAFFDQILVMDPDPALRANRLRLLARVRESFLAVADYSRIVLREEGEPVDQE